MGLESLSLRQQQFLRPPPPWWRPSPPHDNQCFSVRAYGPAQGLARLPADERIHRLRLSERRMLLRQHLRLGQCPTAAAPRAWLAKAQAASGSQPHRTIRAAVAIVATSELASVEDASEAGRWLPYLKLILSKA